MSMSRRDLLSASALLLAKPAFALSAASPMAIARGTPDKPLVLCWNENPYGPSPATRAVLSASIGNSCRYPGADIEALVEAVAAHENVPDDHIVPGSGSGELLCALGLLHGRDGGEIVAATPTYTELTDYAKRAGAVLICVPVDKSMRHDLNRMREAVTPRTRAIYVCNPNNPTGTAVPAADIRAFVASLPKGVTTIVDEAYMDFAVGGGIATVTDLVGSGKRVVVLRTFSKIHGLAGLRCGYAIARPDIVAELKATRMAWPNILVLRAARASLSDRAFLADCRRRIVASRMRITTELTRLNLAYAEPQGNFVFFDTGMPLPRFTESMAARHILVGRRFAPYDNWCRITIGTEPEVAAFLDALRAVTA